MTINSVAMSRQPVVEPVLPLPGGMRAAPDTDPLSTIPGLDLALGLKRILGKRASYESLLRKYVAGQAESVSTLRAHLAAGQRTDAERIAHTLKGVSGNVGAVRIQELAAQVEHAIREEGGGTGVTRSLAALEEALPLLMDDLRRALGVAPPAPVVVTEPASVDRLAAASIVARLDRLLSEDDPEALTLFDQERALLFALFPEHAESIEKSMKEYDMERALVTLRQVGGDRPES
ncbi:MAG: Hpt domain-containing protein [Magnetococcales bacterium]|nr:Hpt domain-containing protein [Magnetococcales bacterium]